MIRLTIIVSALLLIVMIFASKTHPGKKRVNTIKNTLEYKEIINTTAVSPRILFLISDDKNVDASLWWSYNAKPGC